MKKEITNLPASIHQRLLNLSRSQQRTFEDLLINYTNERFLYRLNLSPYASQFVLKGAMAIMHMDARFPRATRDIDFLGYIDNSVPGLEQVIRNICQVEVDADGLQFVPDSVRGEVIKENEAYPGVRIIFTCFLGTAKADLQIDIGIADVIYPAAQIEEFSSLLDLPQPSIQIYQPETILAEKIQTLVKNDAFNSRMKDIYDIWWIASRREIKGLTLARSLKTTFVNRKTPFPETIIIFDETYPGQRQITAWRSMSKKMRYGESLPELSMVLEQLKPFLMPLIEALYNKVDFIHKWNPVDAWVWK